MFKCGGIQEIDLLGPNRLLPYSGLLDYLLIDLVQHCMHCIANL